MTARVLSLLVALNLGATPALPPKVAALEWSAVKVDPELVQFFSDELARSLRAEGLFVVTSSEMAAVVGVERQRQLLGCQGEDRTSCLVELGSALGCDALLAVSLAKLDGRWRANVKALSSRDSTVLAETALEGGSDQAFARELEVAAGRVARALGAGRPPEPAGPPSSARRVAWIPAAGGGALAIAGGVLLGLAASTSAALDEELARQHRVTDTAVRLSSQGKVLQSSGWVGIAVGAAAFGIAAALFLFGADAPVQPAVSLGPQGAHLGLRVEWP